jgi:monofunctional biosynthetic peptidoglycan transglycosylase
LAPVGRRDAVPSNHVRRRAKCKAGVSPSESRATGDDSDTFRRGSPVPIARAEKLPQRGSRTEASSSAGRTVPKRRLPRLLRLIVLGVLCLVLLPYVITPFYRVIDPVSTLMLWRWAKRARVERTVVPIGRIAPVLPRAVIAAEDARFCTHHGIDFDELRHVMRDQSNGVGKPRGGSGITQQLAKNLFLWQGRSYVRKALELPLALWIDLVIPKRRQLEIYLNIVEWGPNGEFGAEAASRRAFGKSASALTAPEAALLAASLPNPIRRDARKADPGLRRLAATYVARLATAGEADRCLRAPR